ncbi:hypothetical protein DFAR_3690062 [Desulfarculales bacterium]
MGVCRSARRYAGKYVVRRGRPYLYESGGPLSLFVVMNSGGAGGHVFQMAGHIDTAEEATGRKRTLSTRDILQFAEMSDQSQVAVRMRLAVGKAGVCRAGFVVRVSSVYL